MSLKDLSDEELHERRKAESDVLRIHTDRVAAGHSYLEAIDAELKRREQKPVLRMEVEDVGPLIRIFRKNGSCIANIDVAHCALDNIDPAALARKISVVEMMWALLRYDADPRLWKAFIRDEYGVDAALYPDYARAYIRAVVEGREPTAEQKAAWGIVE